MNSEMTCVICGGPLEPVDAVDVPWRGRTYRVEMPVDECSQCGFAEMEANQMPALMRRLAYAHKGAFSPGVRGSE